MLSQKPKTGGLSTAQTDPLKKEQLV